METDGSSKREERTPDSFIKELGLHEIDPISILEETIEEQDSLGRFERFGLKNKQQFVLAFAQKLVSKIQENKVLLDVDENTPKKGDALKHT